MLLILFSISLCISWVSPDTNSLTAIYTVTSGIEGFPEITNAAMVNGVQIGYYDSDVRRCIPRQQFMAEYFNVKHWDYVSNLISSHSKLAKENLNEILKMTNQTSGIHILQWIRSVEITEDGSIKRSMRVGFDGRDYISLEQGRMRWVASNHIAVKTKEKWDSDETWNNYWENHLQQVYVQRLKQYLRAGKEYFERKDIEVSWLRDGEVMSETLSSGVRPNHDGTHQIQKEIEINAGDEDQYSCQIEHCSLAETQLYQWEIPEKSGQLLHPGIVTGLVIVGICMFGIIAIYICKRQQRDPPSVTYTTAQTSDLSVPEPS
ncbi:class I histocompatibility antigen, F10 alpha chain-like isoform X3 [Cetorhinus maximus]